MKIQEYRRLTKSDIPEMPEWFETPADAINRQFEALTTLAHGNFTFADNALAEVKKLPIQHDTLTRIELRLLRPPIGVLVLASSFFEFYRGIWRPSEAFARSIEVKVKWDTVPPAPPTVTLLILGG